jgi:predicted Zn-dependent peptidase
VTEKEFDDVTREAIGSFPLSIETAGQVAGRVRTILTYSLPADYYKTYRDEVRKAQLGDMKAMARKYINDVPVVVVVGRADKIESQIKEAMPDATIVHYDTDLKCVEKDTTFCAANVQK